MCFLIHVIKCRIFYVSGFVHKKIKHLIEIIYVIYGKLSNTKRLHTIKGTQFTLS